MMATPSRSPTHTACSVGVAECPPGGAEQERYMHATLRKPQTQEARAAPQGMSRMRSWLPKIAERECIRDHATVGQRFCPLCLAGSPMVARNEHRPAFVRYCAVYDPVRDMQQAVPASVGALALEGGSLRSSKSGVRLSSHREDLMICISVVVSRNAPEFFVDKSSSVRRNCLIYILLLLILISGLQHTRYCPNSVSDTEGSESLSSRAPLASAHLHSK
jgi:hypothetical protein